MTTITTELERKLYDALKRIARQYESATRLRKGAERHYGISGDEAIEMAYENIQQEARSALRGVRLPRRASP